MKITIPKKYFFSLIKFPKINRLTKHQKYSYYDRDDELPKFSDETIKKLEKKESSIKISDSQTKFLKHNQSIEGVLYKYDLPIVNQPLVFQSQLLIREEVLPNTPTENIFDILDIDKDTSYEGFIICHSQHFNNEIDMYGDSRKAGEIQLKVLDFGIPIPFDIVSDTKVMKRVRSTAVYNKDIPGSIENVHPNKFIANLKPVEEFRHTPIIPISEKDLIENRRKIEEANTKGYYLEIKKDTIFYYSIAILVVIMFVYAFLVANEKELNIKYEIDRSRVRKTQQYYKPTRGLYANYTGKAEEGPLSPFK